mgnify:CR=1 FL=1
MTLTKKVKAIIAAIAAAVILLNAILCGTISQKNRSIRSCKATITEQEQTIREQKELIVKLANMEAVRCEVSITVRNTAVMGSNKSGDIQQDAKQLALYLRGEMLEAMQEARQSEPTQNTR